MNAPYYTIQKANGATKLVLVGHPRCPQGICVDYIETETPKPQVIARLNKTGQKLAKRNGYAFV